MLNTYYYNYMLLMYVEDIYFEFGVSAVNVYKCMASWMPRDRLLNDNLIYNVFIQSFMS